MSDFHSTQFLFILCDGCSVFSCNFDVIMEVGKPCLPILPSWLKVLNQYFNPIYSGMLVCFPYLWLCFYSVYYIIHINEIIWYFFLWLLILLSIIHYRFIYAITKDRFSFLWSSRFPLCKYPHVHLVTMQLTALAIENTISFL